MYAKVLLACGSMVLPILCVWFFRAERGKTKHQKQSSTALPKAKSRLHKSSK